MIEPLNSNSPEELISFYFFSLIVINDIIERKISFCSKGHWRHCARCEHWTLHLTVKKLKIERKRFHFEKCNIKHCLNDKIYFLWNSTASSLLKRDLINLPNIIHSHSYQRWLLNDWPVAAEVYSNSKKILYNSHDTQRDFCYGFLFGNDQK